MTTLSPPEPPATETQAPIAATAKTENARSQPDGMAAWERAYESQTPGQAEPRPRRSGALVGGVILIALGLTLLFANWLPGGAAWLFLGLGTAFLVARVLSGRPGYATPAGILLGFGAFLWGIDTGYIGGALSGGLFFIALGLGFLMVYAIAARPGAVWPIFPGLALITFGAFVQATAFGTAYTQYWWIAQFWPLLLIAVGAWFLLRDRLPAAAQTPVAVGGAVAVTLLGIAVAAAVAVSVGVPYARAPMPMTWPMFPNPVGTPPVQDTIVLTAPVGSASSIQLNNTSGTTVVRSTAGASQVSLQATRHFWDSNQPPEVRLVPSGSALNVEATLAPLARSGEYIDFVVDVPAALGADVRSASGSVTVSGLNGQVQITTASGDVEARDLTGATSITTASGGVRMNNILGPARVSTASGGVYGAGMSQVTDVHTMSGGIVVMGAFRSAAQVGSTSGSVRLAFAPDAAVHIEATTVSGSVSSGGLELTSSASTPHTLSGNLMGGGPTVSVRTTSGSILLSKSG